MGKLQIGSDNYVRTTDLRFVTSDTVPATITSATGKILTLARVEVESVTLTAKDAATGEYHGYFAPASVPDTTALIVQVVITATDANGNARTIIEEEQITPVRS